MHADNSTNCAQCILHDVRHVVTLQGCLSPIGTIFMKYGKHLPVSVWFKTHKIIQPLAILVTIIGFIIILASGVTLDGLPPKSAAHAKMGLAVLALCTYSYSIIKVPRSEVTSTIASHPLTITSPSSRFVRRNTSEQLLYRPTILYSIPMTYN